MFETQEVQQLRNIYRRRWPRKGSKIKLLKTSRKTDTLGDNLRQKLVFSKLISTCPEEQFEQFFFEKTIFRTLNEELLAGWCSQNEPKNRKTLRPDPKHALPNQQPLRLINYHQQQGIERPWTVSKITATRISN